MRGLLALLLLPAFLVPAGARAETETIVAFRCGGNGGTPAMENAYVDVLGAGACWGHLGHHTYDTGALHRVGAVAGSLFSVEVQLSPPTEPGGPGAAALLFEGSADGITWTTLATIDYPLLGGMRQGISFSFDAGGAVARFLRIRQPRSAAQGLSGYIDASSFDAVLTPAAAACDGCPGTGDRDCTSVMERVFAEHPCWFGGINRYDAPSVFHTYFLGAETLIEHLHGDATILPWRSDDYTQNGGNRTAVTMIVQTSADGQTWTDLTTAAGVYGVPIGFEVTPPEGAPASFVRLVAERHKGYTTHPALKHARGFLIDSSVSVSAVAEP